MRRLAKILALGGVAVVLPAVTAACGTERIEVSSKLTQLHTGAVLFNQRCAGCHTLAYAATFGSAPNIRTAQAISGPNFNQRCERPIDRVLYAIENGGFSGAYMPQNIVVGKDAVDVAMFVATYAGRQEPQQSGVVPCEKEALGTLPPGSGTAEAGMGSNSTATSATTSAPTSKVNVGASSNSSTSSATSTTSSSSSTAGSKASSPTGKSGKKKSGKAGKAKK